MIQCENLVKIYKTKETEVIALQGLDLTVEDGEMIAIIGSSGSGKSTLLNMIGGLDRPSAGKLIVDGKDLLKFKEKDYIEYKRTSVGFIWQNNARNLIPYMTALENVQVPMVLVGRKERRERAMELLEVVGLADRCNNRLNQLSGGEQQRVAIAIALANTPGLLLADEPTGSLDSRTATQVLDIFRDVNRRYGVTVVIVTHDMSVSKQVDRVVAIRDGMTSSEFISKRSFLKEMSQMEAENAQAEAEAELSHVELTVVDKAGRMQIPKQYLENIGVTGKSRLLIEQEDGKIIISNPGEEEIKQKAGDRIVV